jgi:cell division protein FtsB
MIPLRLMTAPSRARRYLLTTLVLAAMLGLLVYLVSGLSGGERGLAAAAQLRREIAVLKTEYAALNGERSYLQRRVDAMDPQHPDLDMLGEQARRVLFFSEPGELIIAPTPAK